MAPVKYYKLRLIAGGLYIALVIIMSLVPGSLTPEFDPTKNKVASHFTAYFIMMIWYARIYSAKYYPRLATLFILLGISLEYMQEILGTREFQAIDMLFNSLGVLSAWLFARFRFAPAVSR